MTAYEKDKVYELRMKGVGYKAIAAVLGLSRDSVRNFCKTNALMGDASVVAMNTEVKKVQGIACQCCGKPIVQVEKGRVRKFCSEECRRMWWKENKDQSIKKSVAIYTKTCTCCGEAFTSYGNKKRKYCSHKCYIKYRFWEDEENGI